MRKKIIISITTLIVLGIIVDVSLWLTGNVPVTNTIYRTISGAPYLKLNEKTLFFSGTVQDVPTEFFSQTSDGIKLYRAKGVPSEITPPWIYVRKDDNLFYLYRYPKSIGSI
ncbi:hypothetical protein [Paenibacillus ehimensis]|uniref:Uncharacterized protein n=1 Tax=Paenibacillus ehimensis TaxID=79264 RepID=A0ABT8VFT7_9BACL|nr:hypothetical protein [Paenibacillus ehimensis]MDO3679837.1 hypothetical protein [Paenibacillus ehimensis]